MAASGLHISISAEPLFSVGGLTVTNSILTSLIVSILLITFGIVVRLNIKNSGRPQGLQNFAEWVVESLYNLVYSVTESHHKTKKFLPFIATFFLFILLNNWLGLVPGVGTIGVQKQETGEAHISLQPSSVELESAQAYATTEVAEPTEAVDEEATTATDESEEVVTKTKFVPLFRPGTADLNTTLALALFTVVMIQVFGISHLGLSYFKKFINFSSPIMFFVGILEMISEFAKIISFAFRLFGNIFAGEVLLVVISFLLPLVAPLPFYGLEVFVGFIQALVFAMLSLVLYNMATISHDEH